MKKRYFNQGWYAKELFSAIGIEAGTSNYQAVTDFYYAFLRVIFKNALMGRATTLPGFGRFVIKKHKKGGRLLSKFMGEVNYPPQVRIKFYPNQQTKNWLKKYRDVMFPPDQEV